MDLGVWLVLEEASVLRGVMAKNVLFFFFFLLFLLKPFFKKIEV